MTAPYRRRSTGSTDPYGLALAKSYAAPIAAFVGLIVVASLTLGLLSGDLPLPGGRSGDGPGNGDGGPARTPAPSNVVIPDPRTEVPGSIVYAKAGNVWVQSGTTARQVTSSGRDSMPTWSPDGEWIYYVETVDEPTRFPIGGAVRRYTMTYPILTRIRPDGTGMEPLASGRYTSGSYAWFFWIRTPDVSPDGATIALTSDGPDPFQSNIVVQLYDIAAGTFSRPAIGEVEPLGHQDPAWSPDGGEILYVRNDREGARGASAIWRYSPTSGRSSAVTGPGYLAPAWAPNGRMFAATKTTAFGTDIVVVDRVTGAELLRVTSDGRSWSPTWSPKGDAIAFLHQSSGIVDLRMVEIVADGAGLAAGETLDLTAVSGLEARSRPDWFIPADQLPPTPPPTPTEAPVGSPGSSPVASPGS